MHSRRFVLLAGALLVLLSAGYAPASEPHGHAIITFEWIEDSPQTVGPHERLLRVAIQPVVPIRSATLNPHAPEQITISTPSDSGGTPRYDIEPGPHGNPQIILGDLERDQTKVVEVVVHVPAGKSGVAVFTISGELSPGQIFEEKASWRVGTPAGAVSRHGAAEYPARVVPEDPR